MTGRPLDVCVARALSGQTLADVRAGRVAFDCTTRQTALGTGDFWVASTSLDLPAGQEWRIRSGSVWQRAVALSAIYADGHVVRVAADGRGYSQRIQLGAIAEFALPARPAKLVRLVWRIEDAANRRGILLGARVATHEESARSNRTMAAIYSLFGGLCLALILHNAALWGALRHRFQLAYCVMVTMLLAYAFSSSGALAWMWPDIANNDRLRINYLALGGAAAAALMFARSFFEPRVFAGGFGRLVDLIAGAIVLASLAFVLGSHRWMRELDFVYALTFLALLMVVPAIVWRAWVARSDYLWLFGLAWSAPVVMAGFRVAHGFNLVAWSFWLDNSTILAMAAEAMLSSLAIAYRIRLLSTERDQAIAQESASRRLAETDPLTALLNRRAFLESAIGRDGRQRLILVDIDHFKRVNDTLGHDGGDEVLRSFARGLRAAVPAEALVARIGGEEFAIICDAASAIDAELLLAALRAARMPFDLKVTASLGTCAGPLVTETDWKRLYRCADRALFEAKAQGRDRARHAETLAIAA